MFAQLPPLLLSLLPLASTQAWMSLPGSNFCPSSEAWGSCASASWPESNIGEPLQPQTPNEELQAMLAEVDANRIRDIVTTLVGFGTRHTLSNQTDPQRGIGAARDWIYQEMLGFAAASDGRMAVEIQSYVQPAGGRIPFPVKISNVLATIQGTQDPNRTYVVTGHYDSRRLDIMDYTGDAPGADDDATGVAGKSIYFDPPFQTTCPILPKESFAPTNDTKQHPANAET